MSHRTSAPEFKRKAVERPPAESIDFHLLSSQVDQQTGSEQCRLVESGDLHRVFRVVHRKFRYLSLTDGAIWGMATGPAGRKWQNR